MTKVPAIVKRNRYVRRGSVDAPPFVIDKKGSAAAVQRLAGDRATVLAILGEPGTPDHLARAGRAWLDEDPGATPLGAAVVVAALAAWIRYPEDDSVLVPLADIWIARHGLLFAACAAIEQELVAGMERRRTDPSRRGDLYLVPVSAGCGGLRLKILLRVRAAIAGAAEAEYAEVVETLRAYRERSWSAAVATSILLPGERDWVEQDVRAALEKDSPSRGTAVSLLFAAGTEEQARALAPSVDFYVSLQNLSLPATVADGVGAGAAGALLTWFDQVYGIADVKRRVLSVLIELDGDAAFEGLLARIDQKYVPGAVSAAAARFPARAMRLLAEAGSPLLRAHVLGHRTLVDEVLPALGPVAAARVREVAASVADIEYAPLSAVPAVLASPPWQDRAKVAKPVVVAGLTCDDPETVEWAEGERDRWLDLREATQSSIWWERVAPLVADGRESGYVGFLFSAGPEELVGPLLRTIRVKQVSSLGDWVKAVAARFELEALPFVRDAAERSIRQTDALLPYASPSTAVFMADRYARHKSARPAALAWLQRHAGLAARALIPVALGTVGAARRQAETVLLVLPADTVRSAASTYGYAASAAISALFERDPLTLLPARLPAAPAWAVPALLPPVRLRDGSGALPPPAVEALIVMLAISTMDDAYAGIDLVVAACEPADLATFAWELLEAWQMAEADPKQGWVLDALALLGDDSTVEKLTPLILAWPGDGGHAKAVAGVRALAAIGTDAALMRLYGIGQRARFKGLKTAAEEKIAEVADVLRLTAEQLADRLVPDCGFGSDGRGTVEYDSRQFAVGLDEQLRLTLVDSSGRLEEAAAKQFAAHKKEVRTVVADQVQRLERAMVAGRRWRPGDFTRFLVSHPLLQHIVRRLVWTVSNGDSFRVAEDGSCTGVSGAPYRLPEGATVGVAHLLELAPDLVAWAEVLANQQISQPFPQLARETYEAAGPDLKRVVGVEVPASRVLGLERRGWRRSAPQDAGVQGRIEKAVGVLTVVVELEPGIEIGEAAADLDDQTLEEIYVREGAGDRWLGAADRLPLAAVGAVAASEVIRDLTAISAR